MTQEELNKLLKVTNANIDDVSKKSYETVLKLMKEGYKPLEARVIVEKALTTSYGLIGAEIVEGMERIMGGASVDKYVENMKVEGLDLSKKLYQNSKTISNETMKILNEALKDNQTGKDIAKKLYEGYNFKDDPLKVVPKIPKYLLKDVLTANFKRVDKIKTADLRVTYQDLIANATSRNYEKLLKKVIYEKGRYLANRIADYEISRAYVDVQSKKILEDNEVETVEIKINNVLHKISDICDYHSKVDLYGLGGGVYPKDKAPKPPFHTHCHCRIVPSRVRVKGAVFSPNADRNFINGLSEMKKIEILGTKQNLMDFESKKGGSVLGITDKNKGDRYKVRYVGS